MKESINGPKFMVRTTFSESVIRFNGHNSRYYLTVDDKKKF